MQVVNHKRVRVFRVLAAQHSLCCQFPALRNGIADRIVELSS
ncbi:MAG: hypothetical protein JWP84_4498 [Tardiphaga sp.]|nr:hypothetical protein [Tardiphaga sp.]